MAKGGKPFPKNHEKMLHDLVNIEVLQLLDNEYLTRRLKRTKTF